MALNNDQFKEALAYSGAELVPISVLKRMRGNRLWKGEEHITNLAKSIQEEGLREPGFLNYNQTHRTIFLDEGNHRLAAAERLGFTHFPVTVLRTGEGGGRSHPHAVPVRGIDPNENGYVPGTLRPSEVMDWDDK